MRKCPRACPQERGTKPNADCWFEWKGGPGRERLRFEVFGGGGMERDEKEYVVARSPRGEVQAVSFIFAPEHECRWGKHKRGRFLLLQGDCLL